MASKRNTVNSPSVQLPPQAAMTASAKGKTKLVSMAPRAATTTPGTGCDELDDSVYGTPRSSLDPIEVPAVLPIASSPGIHSSQIPGPSTGRIPRAAPVTTSDSEDSSNDPPQMALTSKKRLRQEDTPSPGAQAPPRRPQVEYSTTAGRDPSPLPPEVRQSPHWLLQKDPSRDSYVSDLASDFSKVKVKRPCDAERKKEKERKKEAIKAPPSSPGSCSKYLDAKTKAERRPKDDLRGAQGKPGSGGPQKRSTAGACTTPITKKSPGLQCQSFCGSSYHGKCVGLAADQLTFIKECHNAVWICSTCKKEMSVTKQADLSTFRNDDITDTTGDPKLQDKILKCMLDIKGEMKVFREKQDDLVQSISFCSDKITDFETSLQKVNEHIKIIENLKLENQNLMRHVRTLNKRVNDLEQISRMNNIEIQGVPEKKNEDIFKIIETVHQNLNVQFSPDLIDSAHRVKSFAPNRPKNIVIKYISRKVKDDILAATKIKKMSSPNRLLSIEGVSKDLYISEHLSPENKTLYKKTRDFAKAKNFKYRENAELKENVSLLNERILINERKQKKYNLIVYGVKEEANDLEDIQNFIKIINDRCGVECRFHDFRDWYRIGKITGDQAKPRPIVVECLHYKLIGAIFEKNSILKGSGISVSRDYIKEDYEARKILYPHLREAKLKNADAKIKNNKLIVNGVTYTAEELTPTSTGNKNTSTSKPNRHFNTQQTPASSQSSTAAQTTKRQQYFDEIPPKRFTRQSSK
ncbi:unnamed protein product [Phaedon cochleariae]|uniref:Uncharacterized protein n=1 Tax=Phaedon cochleariae TaxID=80249 RepID=A0A9N9X2I7_PHACE|nr:unnamed protein product [Phaedon cochleariae]